MTLKPCPFCGSEDLDLPDEFTSRIYCRNCCAEGPFTNEDIEKSIELWNKRVIAETNDNSV